MKKFIVFLSSVALVGSVSYAMDEEAVEGEIMDEAMAMEAPAPSVKVSGSAALGIKSVDDGNDATENFSLINEYKVSFSSNGTTDGGLVFGAGISIEDTHDKDPEKSVNSSHVYIGSSDGSWKLQIGGNDPGIDLVGGIGVADDHLQGDGYKFTFDKDKSDDVDGLNGENLNWSSEYDEDATIGLSGSFGAAAFRITMSDPSNSVPEHKDVMYAGTGGDHIESGKATPDLVEYNDWTAPFEDANEDGTKDPLTNTSIDAAILRAVEKVNVTRDDLVTMWDFTQTCGVATRHYVTVPSGTIVIPYDHDNDAGTEDTDLTFAEGEHIPLEMYTDYADDAKIAADKRLTTRTTYTMGMGDNLPNCSPTMKDDADITTPMVHAWTTGNANEYHVAKQMNDQWSAGFTYALDTINIGVGMDSGKGVALSLGSKLSGVDVSAYYSKSEIGDLLIGYSFPTATTVSEVLGTRESDGLGVKASMSAGEGAKFSVAYSKVDMEYKANKREYKSLDGNSEKKKIEIDFTYDLGGGASLQAGIDKEDTEADGKSSDKTTLEAKIAMSF